MATTLTPEENARRVLEIYKQLNSHAGDVLRANNFVAFAARRNWSTRHLSEGLEVARGKGWVEKLATGGIKLTSEGFEAM